MPSRTDFKPKNAPSTSLCAVHDDAPGTGGGTPPELRQASAAGVLGTNAESSSPPKRHSKQNSPHGDSAQDTDSNKETLGTPDAKRRANRAKRYELQSVARAIFLEQGQSEGLLYPENYHKTSKCLWTPVAAVGIRRKRESLRAHYTGLVICSRVFTCPPCASKIQEIRRQEIQKAINWAYEQGFKCVMVTLTFPHGIGDELQSLLNRFAKALEKFRSGKAWQTRKAKLLFKGLIRSLEITFGANGPHPHVHELWIVGKGVCAIELKMDILKRWRNVSEKAKLVDFGEDYYKRLDKLSAFNVHAVDVIDEVSGSDYLAKLDKEKHWGADAELSKASTKKGRKTGRTPFQILETISTNNKALQEGGISEEEAKKLYASVVRDKKLFIDYAKAFSGKAQIFWSQGLKETVGVKLSTDKEAAEESPLEESDLLAFLTPEAWIYVRKNKCRAEVLDVAEVFGYDGLVAWFAVRKISIIPPP